MNTTISAGAPCPAMPPALCEPTSLTADQRSQRRAKLRLAHTAVGVDARYLTLPHGMVLWFANVVFDLELHIDCQGLTRHVYEYALGSNEAEAIAAVRRYFFEAAPQVHVIDAQARRSSSDHPKKLTFTEQVRRLDMPTAPVSRAHWS
jgi:hypothetical protein